MAETRRYSAPAKINLGLEILGRRSDGYHEIRTIFYRVREPHDTLLVTPSHSFRLTCSDESLPTDERNLVVRAARLFSEVTDLALPPIHVHLEKNIPMGAGLGGGSSDAAAMLRLLQDATAFDSNEDGGTLIDSSKIGADVPFFYEGWEAALATGIGEILIPLNLKIESKILVVFDPSIQVSTREAYEGLNPNHFHTSELTTAPILSRDGGSRNDFEPSIFSSHPRLLMLKQSLYDLGAQFALLTGSGSAIYGLFEDVGRAEDARDKFRKEGLLVYLN